MKLAVSMWSYFQSWRSGRVDLVAFIREAAALGAEGVELLDFFYRDPSDPWNPQMDAGRVDDLRGKALNELAAVGLPCPIFSVSQNFAKIEPAAREAELDKIRFGLSEAGRYGAQVVRVFAGDVAQGITFEQARSWIVEGLVAASQLAKEAGLRLALENHGQLAGKGRQVRDLITEVRDRSGCDSLGANPDTGNFLLVEESSPSAVHELADFAYMVHFKDFKHTNEPLAPGIFQSLDGRLYRGAAVGEGIIDLPQCLIELSNAGFEEWISIEYEGEEAPESAVPRSVATAKRLIGATQQSSTGR